MATALRGKIMLANQGASAGGLQDARKDAHQRGFARAIRPQQAKHAVPDGEVDVAQRLHVALIRFCQLLQYDLHWDFAPYSKLAVYAASACMLDTAHRGCCSEPGRWCFQSMPRRACHAASAPLCKPA